MSDGAPSGAGTSGTPQAVRQLLEERRKRLEKDKKAKDVAEKADRKAKADARTAALVAKDPTSAKAKQASYAQEQRRRQQQEKTHREQVLRQIESDKAERREREERRKALAKAEAEGDDGTGHSRDLEAGPPIKIANVQESTLKSKSTASVAVQVRLFDGGVIRTRFEPTKTLDDVRTWVDEQRNDDQPFTFKQILTPSPNQDLSITEEQHTLKELGFIPSATLVMVPIQGATAAYGDAGPGIVSRGFSAGYNTLAGGAGLVTGALGTILGMGAVATQPEAPQASPSEPAPQALAATTQHATTNIRTLRDQHDAKGDHQVYNGNQVRMSRFHSVCRDPTPLLTEHRS